MKQFLEAVLTIAIVVAFVWILTATESRVVSSPEYSIEYRILEERVNHNVLRMSSLPLVNITYKIDRKFLGLGGRVEYTVTAPWWAVGRICRDLVW
jgi:hypothetical protein